MRISDTPERRAIKTDLVAAIASGEPVFKACERLGIAWRRAYAWRYDDAAFRAAWNQARAQLHERPTRTPYRGPAAPPAEPPAPIEVPPSPPKVGRTPRVFAFSVPRGYDTSLGAETQPGDKLVAIFWSWRRRVPDSYSI